MSDEKALATIEQVQLGSFQLRSAHEVIERAKMVARELASIIRDRKLYVSISGGEHVRVEGWTTLGAMLGVVAREVSVKEDESGSFEAIVELVRLNDGMIVGRGSAVCGTDEPKWQNKPRYARRSMSITRATSKAFRQSFSWIITLAGFEATPAEEMPDSTEDMPSQNNSGKSLLSRGALVRQIAVIPVYGNSKSVVAMLQREEKAGRVSSKMSDKEIYDHALELAERTATEKAA